MATLLHFILKETNNIYKTIHRKITLVDRFLHDAKILSKKDVFGKHSWAKKRMDATRRT